MFTLRGLAADPDLDGGISGFTLQVNPRHQLSSEHDTFTQCCVDAGPPSKTVVQHQNSIG